jgi:hypothetical protein
VERLHDLHISVVSPQRAAGPAGTVCHQFRVAPPPRLWGGLRIASPVHTWCLLAGVLALPDLVAVGDFALTGEYPLATMDELAAASRDWRRQRGAATLAAALELVRPGPLSRPESHARLIFMAAGLPEPELNGDICDARGRFVAMSDLVWRERMVAWEYEGEHHATDVRQFRKDILRRERVEDIGWRLTRFTTDDLTLRTGETVSRLAAKLGLRVTAVGMRRAIALSRQIA